MNEQNNPLLCDPVTGVCEMPARNETSASGTVVSQQKPVRIVYFTDPICSSCWGIEPQLRRLKLEYGHCVEISYHMGGLLPDWSYNSGGISKPSDVAHHWDEVSHHYNMPIDGNVWLEDPLSSSYPPSIAFKAAQMQDEYKAVTFLRVIREMVFLEKKNITKWEHLSHAGELAGLDTVRLKQDYEGAAKDLFKADLDLAARMGVRGFPSIFITDDKGNQEFVYGVKPYEVFEQGIRKIYPAAEKASYRKDWDGLFGYYPTMTTREFVELSGQPASVGLQLLERLEEESEIKRFNTRNGPLWKRVPDGQ